MAESDNKGNCFIIMPITTPANLAEHYNGDKDHFAHVLDHLFMPAVEKAGFSPISPKATGADLIQAEIIKQLSDTELVLCDMSIMNPNVFFELGIRTALDKPVALVRDDKTENLPFDTAILNCHTYKSGLTLWDHEKEIENLSKHIHTSFDRSESRNTLWKYFGIQQKGVLNTEEATIANKLDLLLKEMSEMRKPKEVSFINSRDKLEQIMRENPNASPYQIEKIYMERSFEGMPEPELTDDDIEYGKYIEDVERQIKRRNPNASSEQISVMLVKELQERGDKAAGI